MRIPEEQHRPLVLEAPIGVVDLAFARGQANLIKVLAAVDLHRVRVFLDLKDIKAPQLQFVVKGRYRSFLCCCHGVKLRKSNGLEV